jgi:N-acetyl-alpha-D-muramate 1-phosphate uridylyltransferase
LLETGGGLCLAKDFFDEDFVVLNADILTDLDLGQMITAHQNQQAMVTLAVSPRASSRQLLFDQNLCMKGWQNLSTNEIKSKHPQPESLQAFAFSGLHVIKPELFGHITRTGNFSIMDEYIDLMDKINIQAFVHQAQLIDVGKPEAIAQAEKLFI